MLKFFYAFFCLALLVQTATAVDERRERTTFQTAEQWKPTTDVRADVVMCYGTQNVAGLTFEERVDTWRRKGYVVHFMTGIAWGNYQDYFDGRWDGRRHLDEGQVALGNDSVGHGYMIPYIVPSKDFIRYFQETQVRRVIDAGIDALFFEEPEFWCRSGYSDGFKREWQDYYGTPWRAQHESAENTYLSNKLKYFLYTRALDEVSAFAKRYGRERGMDVRCYVPTHSLLNYSQWGLVSPEANLASLDGIDGYIAQVWTGTARTANWYDGRHEERVFENAFLEYGCVESMTAPTGRKVFFLTDPVEDAARDWQDYKRNYEATYAAQLFFPRTNNYEVMPWPDRIYEGLFRTDPNTDHRERIPRFYATQMQVMVRALGDMPLSDRKVTGSHGIGVMMANSLMFQRSPTPVEGYDDPDLSNFYGMALPFVERGVPVKTMHLENTGYKAAWDDVDVVLMTYSNMKPLTPAAHADIAAWVKQGGALVYCGSDDDPFQQVSEWWNTAPMHYARPADHLFELMGIAAAAPAGSYDVGRGHVYILRKDPKHFVLTPGADAELVRTVETAYRNGKRHASLSYKNNFELQRGAYRLAAVLREGTVSTAPLRLEGLFIDLFDATLPVLTEKTVRPGEQAFLYDLKAKGLGSKPKILAAACGTEREASTRRSFTFTAKAPKGTENRMRIRLPRAPKSVTTVDAAGNALAHKHAWDLRSRTLLLSFENAPEGIDVNIQW